MKKIRKTVFLFGMILGIMTLMSTTCNTENDDPVTPECNGYMHMTVSGDISGDYCFTDNPQYTFDIENQRVNFSAVVTIDGVIYSGFVSVVPFTGAKSYECGGENPGYVEFVIHGDNNEFYKSQSGTINITQADDGHLTATFDVSAKGYYNEKSVTLKGSVMKVQ
jgi:hypothetical protein